MDIVLFSKAFASLEDCQRTTPGILEELGNALIKSSWTARYELLFVSCSFLFYFHPPPPPNYIKAVTLKHHYIFYFPPLLRLVMQKRTKFSLRFYFKCYKNHHGHSFDVMPCCDMFASVLSTGKMWLLFTKAVLLPLTKTSLLGCSTLVFRFRLMQYFQVLTICKVWFLLRCKDTVGQRSTISLIDCLVFNRSKRELLS